MTVGDAIRRLALLHPESRMIFPDGAEIERMETTEVAGEPVVVVSALSGKGFSDAGETEQLS